MTLIIIINWTIYYGLTGKLTDGSLSLILNKDRYLKLIKKINLPKGTRSNEADNRTRSYLRKNINKLDDLFHEDEIKFIKYAYKMNGC